MAEAQHACCCAHQSTLSLLPASSSSCRCNVDAAQRGDFLQLASAAAVPAHCLVLQLDTSLCVSRAAGRQGHEGGVEGKSAARVVHQMAGLMKKAGVCMCGGGGGMAGVAAKCAACKALLPLTGAPHMARDMITLL